MKKRAFSELQVTLIIGILSAVIFFIDISTPNAYFLETKTTEKASQILFGNGK